MTTLTATSISRLHVRLDEGNNAAELINKADGSTVELGTLMESIGKKKALIEGLEKALKAEVADLTAFMETNAVCTIEGTGVSATYIEPTTKTSLDTAGIKANFPDIYNMFAKKSDVKGYTKIALK